MLERYEEVFAPIDGVGNQDVEKPRKVDLGNAQELVTRLGKPFVTLTRAEESSDGYFDSLDSRAVSVTIRYNGEDSWGRVNGQPPLADVYSDAYAMALWAVTKDGYSTVSRVCRGNSFVVSEGENPFVEVGFETDTHKWVSRHEGDPRSADVGALVEAGMMVAVHLDLGNV